MKPLLTHLAGRLLVSDLLSSGPSAAVLAWGGGAETGSAAAPLNAVSHWLWARKALRQDDVSARYTLTGLGVHFGAALMWCGLYESLRKRRSERGTDTPTTAVTDAVTVSAAAAVVDLACVPERLTPGFERRLSNGSLVLVYAAFAAGLALSGLAALRGRDMR